MDNSLVSICIPQLGREESLSRLLDLIPKTAGWPHEVIVEHDSFENRQGCPRTLAKAVARSTAPYVAFLGNDTIPHSGWLRIAMKWMKGVFVDGEGMVGFNDLCWKDGRCLHFVVSRAMLPILGGYLLNPCYSHVGSDDEAIALARRAGRYVWCPEAVVAHQHFTAGAPVDEVIKLAWEPEDVARDRALLKERAERMGFAPWLPA